MIKLDNLNKSMRGSMFLNLLPQKQIEQAEVSFSGFSASPLSIDVKGSMAATLSDGRVATEEVALEAMDVFQFGEDALYDLIKDRITEAYSRLAGKVEKLRAQDAGIPMAVLK